MPVELDRVKKEHLPHRPESWGNFNLENFYPKLELDHLKLMETLIANVFECAEVNCGIVCDLTGSASRQICQPNSQLNRVRNEFQKVCLNEKGHLKQELINEPIAHRVIKNPDIDVKVRVSTNLENLPYTPILGSGTSVPENMEHILFAFSESLALEQVGSFEKIIKGRVESDNQEYICWPIGNECYVKITKGNVPHLTTRRYCTVEILRDIYYKDNELKGVVLAEFHMGYEPINASEATKDRRSGMTVSDIMDQKIRLRARDGKLLIHKASKKAVEERLHRPDDNEYFRQDIDDQDAGGWLEREMRGERAESAMIPIEVKNMESLLLAGATSELWDLRERVRKIIEQNGFHALQAQLEKIKNGKPLGEILASLISLEYMITNEADFWWFTMSMANTGLLSACPYFRPDLNEEARGVYVATYSDWLTSDVLDTQYKRSRIREETQRPGMTPYFMRNMKWIMQQREFYLNARLDSENGQQPTSGLMMADHIFNNRPALEPSTRLTLDVFMRFVKQYFSLITRPQQGHYHRPEIRLYRREFTTYKEFFDYIRIQVWSNIKNNPEIRGDLSIIQGKFDFAIEQLENYIYRRQATFNIGNLGLQDYPDLLERLFKSGLITRTGGDRAMFTSPRIVASIWETKDTPKLREAVQKHMYAELARQYNESGEKHRRWQKILSDKQKRKKDIIMRAAQQFIKIGLDQKQFPSIAAIFYYEPPENILVDFIEFEIAKSEQ